jgi:serine protease DegQ
VAHLAVSRDGKPLELSARIEPLRLATLEGGALDPRLAGVSFQDLPRGRRVQGRYGIKVTAVSRHSDAGASGLRSGDIVVGINQQMLSSVQALRRALAGQRPRQLMLTIVRNDTLYDLLVR